MTKLAVAVTLNTAYSSGGDSCTYGYTMRLIVSVLRRLWAFNTIVASLPKTATTVTATSRGTVVGSPPAASARTVTLAPTGTFTVGANEALVGFTVTIQLTDLPATQPYTSFKWMGLVTPLEYASAVWTWPDSSSDTDLLPTAMAHEEIAFGQENDQVLCTLAFSSATITTKRVSPFSISFVENDLVTRPYDPQKAEMWTKVVAAMAAALTKTSLGGLIVTAAQMVTGKGMDKYEIPSAVIHTVCDGALM